jgi:hypothetical protein
MCGAPQPRAPSCQQGKHVPCCLSQVKIHEEAITNIVEAVKGWPEVMESKGSNDPSKFTEVAV